MCAVLSQKHALPHIASSHCNSAPLPSIMSASQPAPSLRRSARQPAPVKSYRELGEGADEDDDEQQPDFDDADVENTNHPNRPAKRRKANRTAKPVKAATQPTDDEWRDEDELADGQTRHYSDTQLLDDSDIRLEAGSRDEESDAGVVLKVELVNFMVHQHFTAALNKHITFIHGANGSGKSAILVALQTVFGAHMRDTNRGSSLAQLIRAGCRDQRAVVTVYLQNDGPNPYTPLTLNTQPNRSPLPHPLVLRMTIVGKLDSALPQMQSRKWEVGIPEGEGGCDTDTSERRMRWVKLTLHELHQLTQFFNIQVSNPCVILTQESGKRFLQSGSPADKYTFFYQATQLDVLKEKHDAGETRIQQMKEEIRGGKEQLKARQRRRDELAEWVVRKEKKDRAEMVVKLAKAQERWSEWKEKVEELERSKQGAEKQAEELAKQSDRVAEFERQNGAFDSSRRDKEQLVNERQQEASTITTAVQAAEEAAAQEHARLRALENKVSALRKTAERAMREQQRKESEIEQLRKEMDEQNAQVDEQRQTRLTELDSQKQRWLAQKEEHLAAYQQIKAEQSDLASQLTNASALQQRSRQSLQDAEGQLQRLRSGQQRGGSAFGARTREIREECERRKAEFDVLPIGPVGDHLQIPDRDDEPFLFAIEVAIGRAMLQGYICHSLKDSRLLLSIFRRLVSEPRQQPQIYIQPKRDHREYQDPKASHPPRAHPYGAERRVLDCLDVKLDWVYNVLVDQREVEAVLIIKRGALRDGEYNRRAYQVFDSYKDARVRAVYTETGAQVRGMGDNRGMTPAPSAQGRLLVVDIGQEVRRMESKRDDVKREEELHRRELSRMQGEQKEIQHRLDRMQGTIRSVDQEVNEILGQLADIENERRNMRREEDLLPLQAERQRLVAEVADLDGQVQDAADKAELQKLRVRETAAVVQQVRAQEEEAMQRVMEARAELDNYATSRQQREAAILREKAKLAKLTEHHTTVLQTIARDEPQLHINRTQLNAMYPIDDFHDWQGGLDALTRGHRHYQQVVVKAERELQLLMEKIQEAVRRQRGAGRQVNVDRMFNEFKKAEQDCEELEVRLGVLEIDSQCLAQAMVSRQRKWLQYRAVLSERLKRHFSVYLSRSGKAGEIQIDHAKAELYIHSVRGLHDPLPAHPNLHSSSSMSGGEKSIVTVAFLMSMWQSVDCPWRAMDEFDVFQDTVNRHNSLRLLIKGAHQTRQRQFLFLTPLDVKDVVAEEGVKVVQMPRPDDRQGVLPYAADQS